MTEKQYKYIRLTAIIGGLVPLILHIMAVTGNKISVINFLFKGNANLFFVLTAFYLMGYIFAYKRRTEGAITLIFTGFIIFMYLVYSIPANQVSRGIYLYSLLYLVPGILFWWVNRQKNEEPKISDEDDSEEL